MRDAQNLAWKLDRVVGHGAPDELLDTYQQERRPHVTTTTRTAMALGELICEGDPARAAERDARLLAEQDGVVRTLVRQDLIPGLTGGLIDPGSPGAGAALPQPFVHARDRDGRLDDVTGAAVRAVVTGPLADGERTALLAALRPLGGVLVHLGRSGASGDGVVEAVDEDGVLSSWLRACGRRIAIARPDHYVYGTAATATEAVGLLEQLRGRLSGPGAARTQRS
jgi:3-(3-hydroxy-phenyl)propionate hydroxylase